jgi:hypothetical protein
MAKGETLFVPMAHSVLTTLATIGVLVFGLSRFIKFSYALLAGAFLCSIPFFAFHSTSQYADIASAHYFLCAVVTFALFHRFGRIKYLFVFAASLALMAYTKDEGVVLASLVLIGLFFLRQYEVLRSGLFWGTFLTLMIPVILVEILMRTEILPSTHIASIFYSVDLRYVMDPHRWKILLKFFFYRIVLNYQSGYFWPVFVLAGLLTQQKNKMSALTLMALVIGLYLLVFNVLYIVSTSDLVWRLEAGFNRVIFQIIPAGVCYMFLKIFFINSPGRIVEEPKK